MTWETESGLYIIGGWNGGEKTSEKILADGSVEEGFALKYSTSWSCAIPDRYTDSASVEVIITGGVADHTTTDTLYTRVSLYNEAGWVRDLAPLGTGRRAHACTSYILGGKKVKVIQTE